MSFAHVTPIDAPAEAVWSVLADLPGWGSWNPVYPRASGRLAPGEALSLTIALPGAKPQRMRARVLAAEPPRRLVFTGGMLGGALKATRSFELTALTPEACSLKGDEVFAGPLAPLMVPLVGGKVKDAVRLVNEALRTTVESRQSDAAGATRTSSVADRV